MCRVMRVVARELARTRIGTDGTIWTKRVAKGRFAACARVRDLGRRLCQVHASVARAAALRRNPGAAPRPTRLRE